jgi:energy-coupling factor transporter transmembrane protein EcfT
MQSLFYIPGHTLLHKLAVFPKIIGTAIYLCAVLVVDRANVLATLAIILTAMLWFVSRPQAPLRSMILLGIAWTAAAALQQENTWIWQVLVTAARLFDISLIFRLAALTTRTGETLQILSQSKQPQFIRDLAYLFNTMLAAFPSIVYELRRAMDAEQVRTGSRMGIFTLRSWQTVMVVTVARTMRRTERFTETVLDRGFSLECGLVPLDENSPTWQQIPLLLVILIPLIFIWILVP